MSLCCFEICSSASRIGLLTATRRVPRWRRPYSHGWRDQLCANCRVLIALFRGRQASTVLFDSIQPPFTRDSLECADPAVDKHDLASYKKVSDRTRDHDLVWTSLRGDTSIRDLASKSDMTLTGTKKHVRVLEKAGPISTQKVGRVRTCRLGPRHLRDETTWIARYQETLEAPLVSLGQFSRAPARSIMSRSTKNTINSIDNL